jgi:hypothetical protein
VKYLLDQEEYDALLKKKEERKDQDTKKLQKFCTMVADTLPVKFWGNEEVQIWGCIITLGKDGQEHYCDECPAQEVCPYEWKEWSK